MGHRLCPAEPGAARRAAGTSTFGHCDRSAGPPTVARMEITGLPLHPLVVHARRGAGAADRGARPGVRASCPRWRWLTRWPTAVASMVEHRRWASCATTSGQALRGRPARPAPPGAPRTPSAATCSSHADPSSSRSSCVAAGVRLPGPSRAGERPGRPGVAGGWCSPTRCSPALLVVAALVVLVQVVLTGDAGLGPSGQSRVSRLDSSRRNESTRAASVRPSATASSSPHSGAPSPCVQPRGQSSVSSARSGNASIRWPARRAPARRTGCRGCPRSSRRPAAQHQRGRGGVPAAAGHLVDVRRSPGRCRAPAR